MGSGSFWIIFLELGVARPRVVVAPGYWLRGLSLLL